jgi:hypothetical protein
MNHTKQENYAPNRPLYSSTIDSTSVLQILTILATVFIKPDL